MNDHRFDEARDLAEQITAREPESPVAFGTLSDALWELGRFEDAAAAAQRMMDLKPSVASYARAGFFRWVQGDVAGAKSLMKQALMAGRDAKNPEATAWTFVQAAHVYWHEADYEGADAVYAEALRWQSDYPAALVGRARCAMARGKPADAVPMLEKALATQPLPETAWLLADARELAGDAPGALAARRRVVEEGKKTDRLGLALYWATRGEHTDEALALLAEERKHRGGIYVDDAYAWALFRAGRLDDARRYSDAALRHGTKDARLLYHAGAIRMAQGDEAGREVVRKALALNPAFDTTGAAEAERLLGGA